MEQESTEQKAIEQKSIDLRSTDLKQTYFLFPGRSMCLSVDLSSLSILSGLVVVAATPLISALGRQRQADF